MGEAEFDERLQVQRVIPALPAQDPLQGEIRWERWERALRLTICLADGTQADMDCDACGYTGDLRTARGMTFWTPEPSWERIAKGTETRSGRSRWQKRQRKPYWVYTHWAQRCVWCGEMYAWRRTAPDGSHEWAEIFHRPPDVERARPPEEGMLF